ncbi:HesA/MoeB/ThiF family protein [Streptomyces formicae]|uniref:Sulfur carrier protein adenylyltransferase ThiF n=1 Tax=Streptomyces formicae TaxID=1616117 RepID=A0A291Q0B9_9ACTN|nr:ThiF family adenylyltransferase [Streptomyces formicae]ATL25051.1 Sulfur carrier protein adenylyltransferase ThiF [Streptomyces formicae]
MLRPRVKPIFPPIPIGGGKIRIGWYDYGIAGELDDDEQGHTWHLLQLLSGEHTLPEIARLMQEFDPLVRDEEVGDAVDQLAAAGYLEDAAVGPDVSLFSPPEIERYRRNVEFFSHFHHPPLSGHDFQARLRKSRIAVVGLGGLGSYAALALTAMGVGELLVVDCDTVEAVNLNRQVLYTDADVGRAKTEAAVERLAQVNPHVSVTPLFLEIDGPKSAAEVFAGRDLVICAADRPRVRIYEWFNAASVGAGVPWVRGGNTGLTVSLFLHAPGRTACFACVQRTTHEELPWYEAASRYLAENLATGTFNPCTAPVAGLLGSIVALDTVKYLTGVAAPAALGRRLLIDLARMDVAYSEEEPRRPDCLVCGDAPRR